MPIIIRSDLVIDKQTAYTDSIQVAAGVTVTIKPGASLDLGGNKLLNYGTVKLEGSNSSFAKLLNGTYSTDSTSGSLISDYGYFEKIDIDSFFSQGSLSFNNTVAKNSTVDALKSSKIENSLFINSPLDIGINAIDVSRSTFYNSPVSADAWISISTRNFNTINFVGASTVFILDEFFSGNHAISIKNSFIDLRKGQTIDDRVVDADDSLRITTDISPISFVSQPYTNDTSGFRVGSEVVTWLMMGTQPVDTQAPEATAWAPVDGAKSVFTSSNLNITFNELIQRGAGPITLRTADGKVVETFTASNATVSGSTLTLNPTADLSIFTKYVVELGAGAVKDAAGNGNAADSRYDFQTATQDGLYQFFVVAFAAAPGATYMSQLAEAVNFGLPLNQIVEIFTTKKQFTDVYPATMSNRELATQLVNNIVKNSASAAAKQSAIDDIDTALGIGWSRGKMLYTVFGNLAGKPLNDPIWGNTAKQFQNQLAVARYFTEEMGVATENLATLRGVIGSVTPDTDVSTVDKIVQIIGTIPPGG